MTDHTALAVSYRPAARDDAAAVAALHADSWQRHYRGAYSDAFLDGPVVDDRLAVWSARLASPDSSALTLLVESEGRLVGFVHVILDADERWGALVDNLHVRAGVQRQGLGRALMDRAARFVLNARTGSALFLWVLEQNVRAQAFYRSLGGQERDRQESEPPGGGRITAIRFVWPDPAALVGGDRLVGR